MNSISGIVYIITNPAMPGIVKIGLTTRDKIDNRLKELFNTSVPVPFECEFAALVDDCRAVENALHIAFGPNRIHPQREFFRIESEQAISILKLLKKEDITREINKEIDSFTDDIDKNAGKELKKQKRPKMNFTEMGLQIGGKLQFASEKNSIIVDIISRNEVQYNGKKCKLTPLTMELLNIDYPIQPSRFWIYNGKSLNDIYNETYKE